jgi:hypothetical protein
MPALLEWMDRHAVGGFDVWDFSYRSLGRPYGRMFLRDVVLRHPLRTVAAVYDYVKHRRSSRLDGAVLVNTDSTQGFRAELADGDWLVGIGFCQKPISPPCPSGRFNHKCWWLAQSEATEPPSACRECQVREVALHALPAGATVHIMTSAADLARDLLLPSLDGKGPKKVVLSLCPYSVGPMSLALRICGLRGMILSYNEGHCGDFAAWVRADEGNKPERTFLRPDTHHRLVGLLDQVADARREKGMATPDRYFEQGNLYAPVSESGSLT